MNFIFGLVNALKRRKSCCQFMGCKCFVVEKNDNGAENKLTSVCGHTAKKTWRVLPWRLNWIELGFYLCGVFVVVINSSHSGRLQACTSLESAARPHHSGVILFPSTQISLFSRLRVGWRCQWFQLRNAGGPPSIPPVFSNAKHVGLIGPASSGPLSPHPPPPSVKDYNDAPDGCKKSNGSLVSLPEPHLLARQLGLHEKKENFFGLLRYFS